MKRQEANYWPSAEADIANFIGKQRKLVVEVLNQDVKQTMQAIIGQPILWFQCNEKLEELLRKHRNKIRTRLKRDLYEILSPAQVELDEEFEP